MGALGDRQEIGGRDRDILPQALQLVRAGHQLVEHALGDRDEAGVRDPGAVVSVRRLAALVGLDLRERGAVELGVTLDRNLRGHATHGVGAAAVAGLNQGQAVALEEVRLHRDAEAIGEHEVRATAELLDEREDVVPAAAVEPRAVLAQLVQDLVHLEGCEDGLDQHRGADRLYYGSDLIF